MELETCNQCNEVPKIENNAFGYSIYHCCLRNKEGSARITISIGKFKTKKTVAKFWNKIHKNT